MNADGKTSNRSNFGTEGTERNEGPTSLLQSNQMVSRRDAKNAEVRWIASFERVGSDLAEPLQEDGDQQAVREIDQEASDDRNGEKGSRRRAESVNE
jgi:hypothetical protein